MPETTPLELRDPKGTSGLDGHYRVLEVRDDGTIVLRRVFLSDEEFDAFVMSAPED